MCATKRPAGAWGRCGSKATCSSITSSRGPGRPGNHPRPRRRSSQPAGERCAPRRSRPPRAAGARDGGAGRLRATSPPRPSRPLRSAHELKSQRNRRINGVSAPGSSARRAGSTNRSRTTPPDRPSAGAAPQARPDADERVEIPAGIGGENVETGKTAEVVMPHHSRHVLADVHQGGAPSRAARSRPAARRGRTGRGCLGGTRCDLPARRGAALGAVALDAPNASTMLGQSKTAHQAEIDEACEGHRLLPPSTSSS